MGIKKLLKADFCIVQEPVFLDSTDNVHYCNNPYNYLLIFIVSVIIAIDKLFKMLYVTISFIESL